MAYDRYTWVDGELITAQKLNHIEDGIAEGGDCDCGFECSEERTTLFEGTVTTTKESDAAPFAMGSLSYPQFISNNNLVVTFDGTVYNCEKQSVSSVVNAYGDTFTGDEAPDFSEYPFILVSQQTQQTPPRIINAFVASTAGEHTIKIQSSMKTTEISECFKKAVLIAVGASSFGDAQILKLDMDSHTYSPTDVDWSKPVIAYEFDSTRIRTYFLTTIYVDEVEGETRRVGTHINMRDDGDSVTRFIYTFGADGSYSVEETIFNGLTIQENT